MSFCASPADMFLQNVTLSLSAGCLGAMERTLPEAGHLRHGRRHLCLDPVRRKVVCGAGKRQRGAGTQLQINVTIPNPTAPRLNIKHGNAICCLKSLRSIFFPLYIFPILIFFHIIFSITLWSDHMGLPSPVL